MKIFSGLLSIFGDIGSVTVVTICMIVIATLMNVSKRTGLDVVEILHKVIQFIIKKFSKRIGEKEKKYNREIQISKRFEKGSKAKLYRWLNDLIIDLRYKRSGITPYEFLFFMELITAVISLIISSAFFKSMFMMIFVYPITLVIIMCFLYTKANMAHDSRIDDIIKAENTICASAKHGVIRAIKENIDLLPESVRPEYRKCIDSISTENKSRSIALMELSDELGSSSIDFIKKCIDFEMNEEVGSAGIFKNIIEINNKKVQTKEDTRRSFEEMNTNFKISMTMCGVVFVGMLAIMTDIRKMYMNTALGKAVLLIDVVIVTALFVYTTYLRSRDM